MTMHVRQATTGAARSYRLELALDQVGAATTAAIAAWSRERISPASRIVLHRRPEGFVLSIAAAWDDPAGDAVNVAWVRACYADVAELTAPGAAATAVR